MHFLKEKTNNMVLITVNWYMLCESDLVLVVFFSEEFTIGMKTKQEMVSQRA